MSMDMATILASGTQVGSQVDTAFGFASDARTTFHQGVEQQVAKSLSIANGLVKVTSTENGTSSTATWMDASRNVLYFDDEAGTRYAYTRDALGRVREVALPTGRKHRARYDVHGRVWQVEREGIANVRYSFDATTGLLSLKEFLNPADDTVVRSVGFTRDGIGRVTRELHTDVQAGTTKTFTYYYDGATPTDPSAKTSLGLLTAVTGDGYGKSFGYRADGLLTKRTVALNGWRTVETSLGYLESGTLGSRRVQLQTMDGMEFSSSAQVYHYGDYGRLDRVDENGSTLATYSYGGNGELVQAAFTTGDVVNFEYDTTTRRRTGYSQGSGRYAASTNQWTNARGLIDSEAFSVGATTLARSYGYSAQRFLTSATDSSVSYGYGFDGFGLPRSITKGDQTKAIEQTGSTLTAGSVTYAFDAIGRTVARDDLTITYGPDGQMASATRGGSTWSFKHDENGQRILKLRDGVPVAAYLEEGYLDSSGLSERFQVGGRTVGLVKDGLFTLTATDPRGTVMAETDGTPRIASPFGQRDVRPSVSPAIDYVEKGYDADLGLVRMGVRDYDPEINRFVTADPLFLESPEKCVESPVECNLYGYARNAPAVYVDPRGAPLIPLIDAGFILYDIGSFAYHKWTGNQEAANTDLKALVVDGLLAVAPGPPGGGLAVRGAERAGVVMLHAGAKEGTQALVKAEQVAGRSAAGAGERAATDGAAARRARVPLRERARRFSVATQRTWTRLLNWERGDSTFQPMRGTRCRLRSSGPRIRSSSTG